MRIHLDALRENYAILREAGFSTVEANNYKSGSKDSIKLHLESMQESKRRYNKTRLLLMTKESVK
jgi:hypothetical protein